MGFYKKTILLKNPAQNMGMGLLTIEKTNSGIFGTLKAYDIPSCDNMVLGISVNGKGVLKQNIYFANDNSHTFKLNNDFDIDGKIGCVLVHNLPTTVKPLVWGSNNGKASFKEDIINLLQEEKKPINEVKTVESKTQEIVSKEVFEQNEVEKIKYEEVENENNAIDIETLAKNNESLYNSTQEEIEKAIDDEMEEGDFYDLIKEQIDDLFERFPRNTELENLVDYSKWVTIDFDNAGKDYVVGLLYDENNTLEYIAYGVPGSYDVQPPSQIIDYSQWLPLDPLNVRGRGYWVMFQDAITGDSVKLKAQDIS